MHIDSFSGPAANLPRGERSIDNVLKALAKNGRVSCFDMDQDWLRNCIARLQQEALIVIDRSEEYPWLRYHLTAYGKSQIEGSGHDGA